MKAVRTAPVLRAAGLLPSDVRGSDAPSGLEARAAQATALVSARPAAQGRRHACGMA